MIRRTSPALVCLGLVGSGLAAPAVADRPKFTPFITADQYAQHQFSGTGDSVTYTEVTAGIAGEIKTRRIIGTVDYRFSQRLRESGKIENSRSQNGVARVRIELVKDLMALDAGGIVTHTRVDPGGAAPQVDTGAAKNLTQVYGGYIQPSIARSIGELDVSGTYRYGYVITEGRDASTIAGIPVVNRFESSMSHQGDVAVGMKRSSLPFDWSVTGHYGYETSTQLAKRYKNGSLIAEVIVPFTDSLAFVSSGGYESTQTSERAALLMGGVPVLTSKGKFVTDPNSPRTLTYDVAGLVADGGIIWAPSQHTRFEARAGYRYGGFTTSASFEYEPGPRTNMSLIIFDRIDSFGRGLTDGLAQVPASFDPSQGNSSSPYENCLFGKEKASGTCIGGSLASSSASIYRSRGGTFVYTYRMRQTSLNFAVGYTRRLYLDSPTSVVSLAGVVDESIFIDGGFSHQLARDSGINFAISANLFKNGQVGVPDVMAFAANGGYFRSFGKGLRAQATVGVDYSKQDGITADVSGRAQLGIRYQF